MRPIALPLLLLALPVVVRAQQTPAPPPLRIAASSYATVEVHLNSRPIGGEWYAEDAGLSGPSRIAISYGQPHARGRRVEGGLIPRDTVWRFGANMATALHTDLDLTVGGAKVPHGDYSLFILQSATGWQLVVSRATAGWGTDYDASRDLVRIPLARRQLAEPRESLSIFLIPQSANPRTGYADLAGTLRIEWGNTELTAPWSVDH
jgi:hypothetical protein